MHIRVCRDCGEEYRPEIAVCADCGGVLEDRYDDEAAQPPIEVPAAARLPFEGDQRVIYSAPRAADVEPLAERLGALHVPFAVRGGIHAFELLVGEQDVERAVAELRALLGDAIGAPVAGGDWDPEGGYRRCPACGHELPLAAEACPDCGLSVAAPETRTCPSCGAPADPAAGVCPSCGFGGA